jgi:hypothetical protein
VLPAASVAATENLCVPGASALSEAADVHGCAAAPSSEHVKCSAVPGAGSVPEKSIVASVAVVAPVGAPEIVVSGACVSTVQSLVAGLVS